MKESKIFHHRLVDCQEHVAFTTEDGINVFSGSAAIKTCINCDHSELSSEVKEIIDSSISEKRKNPLFPTKLFELTKGFL
ncbi:hypothetical protein [Neobacillus niacini]|jgi:hypothetical protein|uniref:hypothetical protein n=1 Tax=Neobacillus niacini TaxID=86668 RepID=UPI001C8D3193|nr:hypothetical protein [Neobacillus niacini]MBY0146024.1 hypothetical protein [Neobacillus niacini]